MQLIEELRRNYLRLGLSLQNFCHFSSKCEKKKQNGNNPLGQPEVWRTFFLDILADYLKEIDKKKQFPSVIFIPFLLSDEQAHRFGYNSLEYQESIQVLDFLIKTLIEGINSPQKGYISGFKDHFLLENINWCICSDHSGRIIHRDNYIPLNSLMETELELRLIEGIQEQKEMIMHKLNRKYHSIHGLSLISNGFWGGWFYNPHSSHQVDFTQFLNERFFHEITPISQQKSTPIDLIKYLLEKSFIEFIIIPEYDSQFDNQVKDSLPRNPAYHLNLISHYGIVKIYRNINNKTIKFEYTVISGQDPLGYSSKDLPINQEICSDLWLQHSISSRYPDLFSRLYGFFDCRFSPNILVTVKSSHQFWSIYDCKKIRGDLSHIQTHDGLSSIESIVPVVFAGSWFKKAIILPFGRNIDILPTILAALDIQIDNPQFDGQILKNILI